MRHTWNIVPIMWGCQGNDEAKVWLRLTSWFCLLFLWPQVDGTRLFKDVKAYYAAVKSEFKHIACAAFRLDVSLNVQPVRRKEKWIWSIPKFWWLSQFCLHCWAAGQKSKSQLCLKKKRKKKFSRSSAACMTHPVRKQQAVWHNASSRLCAAEAGGVAISFMMTFLRPATLFHSCAWNIQATVPDPERRVWVRLGRHGRPHRHYRGEAFVHYDT